VFNIFKFELNPLDGGEDMGLCVLFGTLSSPPSNGLSSNLKMINTSAQVETI
jgi:hypothetical protein